MSQNIYRFDGDDADINLPRKKERALPPIPLSRV
jgi:hypothetical protein